MSEFKKPRECFRCGNGKQILLEKKGEGPNGKAIWEYQELDGSPHTHVAKEGSGKKWTPQPGNGGIRKNTEEINKAHKENIEESRLTREEIKALRQDIQSLTDAVNAAGTNLASAISELVGGDLTGLKNKSEDPIEGTKEDFEQ